MEDKELLKQLRDYLSRSEFFSELSEQEIEEASEYFEIKSFMPGDVIYREGDKASEMAIVLFGTLKAVITKDPKPYSVELKDGTIIGEVGLLGNVPRTADVVCATPAVVAAISRESYERMKKENPVLALKFIEAAARILAKRFENVDASLKKTLLWFTRSH